MLKIIAALVQPLELRKIILYSVAFHLVIFLSSFFAYIELSGLHFFFKVVVEYTSDKTYHVNYF